VHPPVVHPVVHPVAHPVAGGAGAPASGPVVTVRPASQGAAQPTALPFTGSEPVLPLGIALILTGSGLVLTSTTRRRQLI
jgi:hypothetical protein